MPVTREVGFVVRATGSKRGGAGEPPGEPAPPPGILDGVPDEIRGQLPDEVIDQLLAVAGTEAADVDLVVVALGDLLQVVVLVSLGLEVKLHLGASQSAEVTLDVKRISPGPEHESSHERGVEDAAAFVLLNQICGRAPHR